MPMTKEQKNTKARARRATKAEILKSNETFQGVLYDSLRECAIEHGPVFHGTKEAAYADALALVDIVNKRCSESDEDAGYCVADCFILSSMHGIDFDYVPTVQPTEPAQPADTATDDAETIRTMLDSLPTVIGPVPVFGAFVDPETIEQNKEEADRLAAALVASQLGVDLVEHNIILSMLDRVVQGKADVKGFVIAYGEAAKLRGMKDSSIAARKSNLKKVMLFAGENQEFLTAITADENMGLQSMYALRAEMLKLAAPKTDKVDKDDSSEAVDDGPVMTTIEVLLQQLVNAQDAAANCGFDDITEKLRGIFYEVKAKEIEAAN